jgi:hypothetical protein
MEIQQQSANSSEFKPEATTPNVPVGKPFPNFQPMLPEKMDTETLTAFITSNAKDLKDLAIRSEFLKPYYLELRSRISQKEWDQFCNTTFGRTRRAIDYWLAGGNPVSKRKGHAPQYACPTPDGHNNMEARSAFQKGIRLCPDGTTESDAIKSMADGIKAGNEDHIPDTVLTLHEQNVMYWTDQLYRAGADMWKKVFVVLYEDIGLADLPVWDEVRKIGQDVGDYGLKDGNGGDKNAVRSAVLLLCRAKKSRATDNVSVNELINPGWRLNTQADIDAAMKAAAEAEKVKREVPDFALDKHNPRGKALGRGLEHFVEVGAKLGNPATDVREVFSPDYVKAYAKGFADGVASVTTPPTGPEPPKPKKTAKTPKSPVSPAGQVHIDELPPEAREKVMSQIEAVQP